ncbi:MAG: glycosyltransferase family 2 protein [Simkaniaceae bacterium]|nr:glycosyltransferase family 2 protein [Simkaniaceae bacterium]
MIKSKKEPKILPTDDFSHRKLDPVEDKTFTFIVLTRNDVQTIERNYESISTQRCDHFNIIYIDQGSNDGTIELLREKVGSKDEIQIIECKERYEAYETYYQVVFKCPDDRVIVHLYGSDWLMHEDVLSFLSQSHAQPDVWLSYGQYIDYLNYQKGVIDPKPKRNLCKNRVQKAPWVVAPLKTYDAGLFKKLHVEGDFFLSIGDENAFFSPMAELGKAHVRFIPEVLLIHSEKREGNRRRRQSAFLAEKLKGSVQQSFSASLIDRIIFSENMPENLEECLSSTQNFLDALIPSKASRIF